LKLVLESERGFWQLAGLLFALLVGVNYFPVLTGRVPLPWDIIDYFPAWFGRAKFDATRTYADIGDLVTSFYPYRAFAAESIRRGILPLWNPHILFGAPFNAAQAALFYPLNSLYYILPLPLAWTLGIILKMFLSAVFMALFVRSIGGSRTGAIFSAIVFASCGFMTAWQGTPMSDAALWLPLICYAVQRLHRDRSTISLALAAFSFAMPVLAGHPETAFHVTLTGTAWAIVIWASSINLRGRSFDTGFLVSFTLVGLLALGVASIQMIPTVEWVGQMGDTLGARWPALPLHQALSFASRDILRGPNSAGILVPEGAAYLGMITLLAASLALFHRARTAVLFLAVLTLVSFGIVYGIEPLNWISLHIPVLNGIKNKRMILLGSFGIAILAGLGISALEEETRFSGRKRLLAVCLLAVPFLIGLVLAYELQLWTEFKIEFMRRPSFSRTLLLVGAVPILWRLWGGLRGRLFPIVTCGIAMFDLATFSYGYAGFGRPADIFPPSPVFDFLAKNLDPASFRVAQLGSPYLINGNMMYGVSSADGFEARLTPEQRTFTWDIAEDRMESIYFNGANLLKWRDRRFDLLNVKYLVVTTRAPEFKEVSSSPRFQLVFNNGYAAIFENKSVLPRAFAVPASGIEVYEDRNEQLARLRNPAFNPEQSVILSQHLPSFVPPGDSAVPFTSKVEMTGSQVNELAFRTEASKPALLVLSQTYYTGWKATVDGADVPVVHANIALTGIPLPAGTHDVRFRFQPWSFRAGAWLTLMSTVIIGGLLFSGLRSQPRHEHWVKRFAAVSGLAAIAASVVVLRASSPDDRSTSFRTSQIPVEIGDKPASIKPIAAEKSVSGHARLDIGEDSGAFGLSVFAFNLAYAEASESVIPATSPVTAGLLPFRLDDKYKTAIAISNPNNSSLNVRFSANPDDSKAGFDIPANGQISAFLDQSPFNVKQPAGTLHFEFTAPAAISALLTYQDGRSPFLMAPLPIASPDSVHNRPAYIPYVMRGDGWSVELILVNPTTQPLTGHHRWYSAPGNVTDDVPYSIPPQTSLIYKDTTSQISGPGWINVLPQEGQSAPQVTAVLFRQQDLESSLVTISGTDAVSDASLYAAVPGLLNTEIAIANPSGKTALVRIGSDFSVPAGGVLVVPAPALPVVHVTSTSPVAVAVLRNLTNPGNPRLVSSYPASLQSGRFFPQFAVGGAFTTEFIFLNNDKSAGRGVLRFFDTGGSPLELAFRKK